MAPGRKVYGRSPEEIRQRVAIARRGGTITGPQPPWLAPMPASGGSPKALRPAATATRAGLRPEDVPGIRGTLDLAVNRPFRDGRGRLLQLDYRAGDPNETFRGTAVELNGRAIAKVGDGQCFLQLRDGGLTLTFVPTPGDQTGETAIQVCREGCRLHATARGPAGGRTDYRERCREPGPFHGQMVDHIESWTLSRIVVDAVEFAFEANALVV